MGLFDRAKEKVDGINRKRKDVRDESKLVSELKLQKWVLADEDNLVGAVYVSPSGEEGGFFQYYTKTDGSEPLTEELLECEYVASVKQMYGLSPNYEVLAVDLTPEGEEIVARMEQFEEPVFGPDERFDAMWTELDEVLSRYVDELIDQPGVGYILPVQDEDSSYALEVFLLEDRVEVAEPTDLFAAPFVIDIDCTVVEQKDILRVEVLFEAIMATLATSTPGIYEREERSERAELAKRLEEAKTGV